MLGFDEERVGFGRSGAEDTRMPVPTKNLDRLSSRDGGVGVDSSPLGFALPTFDFTFAFGVDVGEAATVWSLGTSNGVVGRLPKEDFLGLERGMPKI